MTGSAEPALPNERPAGSAGAPGAGSLTVDGSAPGAAGAGIGRLPDFFIVGHEKCGTTALHSMLSSHPQIFMSSVKEPRFFAMELRSRFRRLGADSLPRTLESYCELFAAAAPEQRVGEASPLYLRSRTAAKRIAEVQPDARIIAILREPASFLRSFHLQAVHNHVETEKDFARAMALEPSRREGRRIPRFSQAPESLLYSEHVRYVEQLRRYHAVFAPEQVLVLIYEDFRADNDATVRRVLRFLDVDDTLPVVGAQTEPLQGVRSVHLLQLGLALTIARRKARAAGRVPRAIESVLPRPTRSAAFRKRWRRMVYCDPPPRDEAFMLELRRRFAGEVAALSEYLQRDLVTLWGYDGLG